MLQHAEIKYNTSTARSDHHYFGIWDGHRRNINCTLRDYIADTDIDTDMENNSNKFTCSLQSIPAGVH